MREIWKPVMLSAAVLLLSSPATQAGNPREESNAQHQVHTAVGFVEDLAGGRAISALLKLRQHDSGNLPLTPEDEDILRELRSATLSFKDCMISEGVVLEGLRVRLIFAQPCGDNGAYGVDVQLTRTEEKFHPSGFTLLTNEVL